MLPARSCRKFMVDPSYPAMIRPSSRGLDQTFMVDRARDTYVRDVGTHQGRCRACVDAPFGARKIFGFSVARSQVLTCVRPRTRRVTCRRPVWDTRIGSTPPQRAQGARPNSDFPGVVQTWVTREGEF